MKSREYVALRRAILGLWALFAAFVGTISAFYVWNAYQSRAVAVDAVVSVVSKGSETSEVRVDWMNVRDCEYVTGSFKFVNALLDDAITPRRFFNKRPYDRLGSRGVGPQSVGLSIDLLDDAADDITIVARHRCGGRSVLSVMGTLKTADIFSGAE